jgi:hypothetical protein
LKLLELVLAPLLLLERAMTVLPTTASLATNPTWDGDRRVAGGALAGDPPALQGDDEFTFGDFLSILNPLQHLPVVSNIYRWVTGDTIKPAARVVGGALYGGPIGLVTSALNAMVEEVKGGDVGAQVLALFKPDQKAPSDPLVASAAPDPTSAPVVEGDAALLQLAKDLQKRDPQPEGPEASPVTTPAAPPLMPGQARKLSFYQANAGERIAPTDNGHAPTKYALPIAFQGMSASKPLPIPAAEDKSGTTDATPPQLPQDGTPGPWFASAMMRGLDRYRASQQLNKPAPQVDVSQ